MVEVDFSYNPYLMETSIKLNGREPFANSLVERYRHDKLQNWIADLPAVIRDEMNGFGFKFGFSGPEMDFEQLKRSFKRFGASHVTLFHKNIMESRSKKTSEIQGLLDWLQNEKNNNFDNDIFMDEHVDIFEEDYSFFTVNGHDVEPIDMNHYHISVVNVDHVQELGNVELNPVIYNIDKTNLDSLPVDLLCLLDKQAVANQLFFMIGNTLNVNSVRRVISDIGVHDPQIIDTTGDKAIEEFFLAYAVTDRINKAVCAFNDAIESIKTRVSQEEKEYGHSDESISTNIDKLTGQIDLLKKSNTRLVNRDNIELPVEASQARDGLANSIRLWKQNKITLNPEQKERYAENYEKIINGALSDFKEKVDSIFYTEKMRIIDQYYQDYALSEFDEYKPEDDALKTTIKQKTDLKAKLLGLFEVHYSSPKDDLKFLFMDDRKSKEIVKTTVYNCEKWREYALSVIMPIADDYIKKKYDSLMSVTEKVAQQYIGHIQTALEKLENDRAELCQKLSKEEQSLQNDIGWLSAFEDKVTEIESV